MPSVPSNIYPVLMEISRYLFAILGVLIILAVLAWIVAENRSHKERLRSLPAAGMIGELVVLSGSSELAPQTWFPVPREGVLGSFRSCDLVVPCSGVKARHLDFVWQDGVGLLIRPRSGCQVQVNNALLDCHSDFASCPLTHGGFLQIGEALLRLQVFKALDHTAAETGKRDEAQSESFSVNEYPAPDIVPGQEPFTPVSSVQYVPGPNTSAPVDPSFVSRPAESCAPEASVEHIGPSPRRGDRWKEDWGE